MEASNLPRWMYLSFAPDQARVVARGRLEMYDGMASTYSQGQGHGGHHSILIKLGWRLELDERCTMVWP